MIVAITGGNGFIGKLLVARHRALGDDVRVLTRSSLRSGSSGDQVAYYHGDLTQPGDELRHFVTGADVLYHCAGEIRNPDLMAALHVQGTQRLINAASGQIGRWVQLSSVGVYGRCSRGVIDETAPINPVGTYEITKAQSDLLVQSAAAAGAFEATTLRPSIVFGPSMTNRSLYQWISMIARRMFFFIGRHGASANYVYVDNVLDALYRCATDPNAAGRTYNISDWRTIESFVGAIAQCLGISVPRLRVPEGPVLALARLVQGVPGVPLTSSRVQALCNRVQYSSQSIVNELGYFHVVSMEKGLERMVARWLTCQSSRR